MANTGAHIVDRVLPNLPVRQWVLSLPFDLRALAAKDPSVVSAIDRILFREVERFMRRTYGPSGGRAGAITFVQRFGGSLNLHVHFHVLFVEGLFTRDEGTLPVFHRAHGLTRADLHAILTRVRDAVQRGLFDVLPTKERAFDDPGDSAGKHSIAIDGFNLHAAVSIPADDDVARERLVRYCARPPFALDRLELLEDGRIAYRIKQPRRNATHRILEPIELLARIAALVPPPRHPSVRYHGVLAPSSKLRAAIVPRPIEVSSRPSRDRARPTEHTRHADQGVTPARPDRTQSERAERSARRPSGQPEHSGPASAGAHFATHTEAHRARLAPDTFATSRRLEWSTLLRRTFAADVLDCPRCHGECTIVGAIQDPSEARRFLTALDQLSIATPSPPLRVSPDDEAAAETSVADDADEVSPPAPDD